ncbi:glycyl-radical enzyme activating protein [Thermophilibacter provencensis]|uniref:glycyl-radical enzyme activating protein n=1 Tax=Thermophilibacter provencensis TaxID=1852386 RepID=UPI00094B42D2|nr:glycyl-radical enzyme activating protein [Thermophilibacter provencensis]
MGDADKTITVMNLERFATHDGPGIRTAVFVKGCPLHCPWCANPETQSLGPVHFVDGERCVGCGECARSCPNGAISLVTEGGRRRPRVDPARCSGCRACERACLREAIVLQGHVMSVGEVLSVAERDRDYYEASGGGVTLSGGEPLMFADTALAFLREARVRGLDTAVETTGNVAFETLRAVEPYVDHFLYDVKSLDESSLRNVVGGSVKLNQEGLRWLAARCPDKINARVAVIPGFNFDDEELKGIIDWLWEIGVRRVNLLPYHTLGLGKYAKLGRDYACSRSSLRDEDLEELHEYALSRGMESKVGA